MFPTDELTELRDKISEDLMPQYRKLLRDRMDELLERNASPSEAVNTLIDVMTVYAIDVSTTLLVANNELLWQILVEQGLVKGAPAPDTAE
ncbi:MAG: hypothetical protein U1D96_11200 [Eubacteriales bacterium]|jgi:hypothetical protein|nr:hypothetical protein [Bacillota bacterium]MBV1726964.1 hypothetical protein [Desulforudis sp.]MDQ7788787.1 hypothetical protein [Clostridia bacterium]MDZ4044027.1 hypothetical protein [Eubacteriales bacterium]MBU4534008.1 hypothetical protein [Bacillota bacterium]